MKRFIALLFSTVFTFSLFAQSDNNNARYRVIIDNDFGGDPDGLVQLAHQLLSPTTEIRSIICSEKNRSFPQDNDPIGTAVNEVNKLLSVMKLEGQYRVLKGSNEPMTVDTPADCEGAREIIAEALRPGTKLPLFILCGASLKTIASAWILEPAIADKITVIWIGGESYGEIEYLTETNIKISIPAAQVVFNHSEIPVWQVPKNAYDNTLMSFAEMKIKLENNGTLGKYLYEKIFQRINIFNGYFHGETYTMGDSPLVLLSALQSFYDKETSSSNYIIRKTPYISNEGFYSENTNGRDLRVYTDLDVRLMFDDLESKLKLWSTKEEDK